MDDVTDTVFRRIVADCAKPDLTFTEFVNVDGLCSPGKQKLLHKLDITNDTIPVVAQLWGKAPEHYGEVTGELAESGKYAGIDINFGCPEKTIVNNGSCSAFINKPDDAIEIIKIVQQNAGALPVSVKTRLGFNIVDLSWIETLLRQNIDMLTVHLRTRKEMSLVPAHWEYAADIMKLRDEISPNTKIIGNGDIASKQQGRELAEKYGLDGVMIGRGVFHDPYCFADQSPWPSLSREDRVALYRKHVELFVRTWKNNERRVVSLNKFCKIYINGFDGAKEMRERLMRAHTTEELLSLLS